MKIPDCGASSLETKFDQEAGEVAHESSVHSKKFPFSGDALWRPGSIATANAWLNADLGYTLQVRSVEAQLPDCL